jgi:transposase InsO family protein
VTTTDCRLSKWNGKPSKKGRGFVQPLAAHQHWQIDVSYINISGTFYYLYSILDGCSRYIVNWDLRESMTEADIEIILERAKKMHPVAKSRIISDNGPQFIAKDFKECIRISGMTHVRTSPYYPNRTGNRTLEQITQRRVHPAGNAIVAKFGRRHFCQCRNAEQSSRHECTVGNLR